MLDLGRLNYMYIYYLFLHSYTIVCFFLINMKLEKVERKKKGGKEYELEKPYLWPWLESCTSSMILRNSSVMGNHLFFV